jgi:hypothetical protein
MSLDYVLSGGFAVGVFAGIPFGLFGAKPKLVFPLLLILPVAMIPYISRWHDQHPEKITSTSGLDFFFGPLWPVVGAISGFYTGKWLRAWCARP